MKKNSLLFIFAFIIGINTFAQEQNNNSFKDGDYLITWTCGGMVAIPHHTLYCITNAGLSSDTSHITCFAPKDISDLHLGPLSQSRYAKAKLILNSIPAELLKTPKSVCGRPWKDGITTYVLAFINGKKYQWAFFSDPGECSSSVAQFVGYLRKGF